MKKIELLAPAGNFECLVAAVQSGADAVYLSGKAFGARSYADNFGESELEEAVDYCHLRGVKLYVTVNTIVSDAEIDELCSYLRFLNDIGTDAIIVQDMGVVKIAREIVPKLPIHASTQMTVHNSAGVKALEKLGIGRVVLARELSLSDIKQIAKEADAELEIFGHGALCMCYSGQCLMSSIIGGRSGNRGKCAQPCRLMYSVNDNPKKAFYMSLKDLSSLKHICEMAQLGASSLKIEGRMKGPAYVAAVVGVYRKYLDNPQKIKSEDIELLDSIFNRGGLTDGYLTGKLGKDMFAFDKPDNPYTKSNDKITDTLLGSIKNENRKLYLECRVAIRKGYTSEIVIENDAFRSKYTDDAIAEEAKNAPLKEDYVKTQINKTGGTPFAFSDIKISLDDDAFLTAKQLNNLRRKGLELFAEGYLKSFKRKCNKDITLDMGENCSTEPGGYVCEVTTIEQFDAVKKFPYKLFYIPLHLLINNQEHFIDFKDKTVVVPPAIIGASVEKKLFSQIEMLLQNGFYGVSANNIALVERFKNYRLIGGFRLNIFNSFALDFYKSYGMEVAEISPELNLRQIEKLTKTMPVQAMVYGRLPLMVAENCVIKNGSKCPCDGKNIIIDRLGMEFPVIKDGNICRSVILNCKKTFMAFDMDRIKKSQISYYRVYFTDESVDECERISKVFMENLNYRPQDFTNGHFNKGVQ